jgi:cytochrome c oxidase cbb3-type subunit 2
VHIRTVLGGLAGKTIDGVAYASAMPAFAGQLTDEEVAAVSHERTSWGNQAPSVKPEDVIARR